MKKVLVTCDMPASFLTGLRKMNFLVDYETGLSNENIQSIIGNYAGLIVSTPVKVNKAMIDEARSLEFVGRAGSGIENIDETYARSKGVACFNSPEGNCDAVGEHATAMLLMLLNNLHIADSQVKNGHWSREQNRGTELKSKTVGIIGYGHTGSAFARKLAGFEAEVLAYDKYKKGFGDKFVQEVSLEKIFERTDILSFHIPLTDETLFWADTTFFSSFQKPVILINTSRGKVVRTADLVGSLRSGQLAGACLDVLEEEPITPENMNNVPWFYKLSNIQNVILSPHIAGWTHESKERIGEVLLQKIKTVTTGS